MFKEPVGTKVFDAACLAEAPTYNYELKMDVQKASVTKDTYGPLSSANSPVSVVAPKPLSSNIDSRYFYPNKITSIAYQNVYPPTSLNPPAPFGGKINSKSVNSSFSGEGS